MTWPRRKQMPGSWPGDGNRTGDERKDDFSSEGGVQEPNIPSSPYTASQADILKIFFLLSRPLNLDIALQILEASDLARQHYEKTFTPALKVRDSSEGRILVRTDPLRVWQRGTKQNSIKRLSFDLQGCHDQGWASDRNGGSWTWYTAVIVSSAKSVDGAREGTVRETTELARNALGSRNAQQHAVEISWESGRELSERDAGFLGAVRDGDVVEVRACAMFPGWTNFVEKASLDVEMAIH